MNTIEHHPQSCRKDPGPLTPAAAQAILRGHTGHPPSCLPYLAAYAATADSTTDWS